MTEDGMLSRLKEFFGKKTLAPLPVTKAEALYHQILQASRSVTLYRDYGVEDSIDGRFDALCLMQSLVMRRLSGRSEELSALSQELFDAMFADMDLTLREMGVGDMGVGKRVKFMSEAYMGRLKAYDDALSKNDQPLLAQALFRNLYREEDGPEHRKALSVAVMAVVEALNQLDDDAFDKGAIDPAILEIGPKA